MKEESKKRTPEEPGEDMPREFWSQLLLLIDGWTLEKKISVDDAQLLRDGRTSDIYMACKELSESETISAYLELLSSATRC